MSLNNAWSSPYDPCLCLLSATSVDSWTKGCANGDMPWGATCLCWWRRCIPGISYHWLRVMAAPLWNCQVHQHQKRLKLFHLQGKWWWSHFFTVMKWFNSMQFPLTVLLQQCTTYQCWLNCGSTLQRNGQNFIRLDGDFIRTTHGLMSRIMSCSFWLNLTIPVYHIRLIAPILLPVTSYSHH